METAAPITLKLHSFHFPIPRNVLDISKETSGSRFANDYLFSDCGVFWDLRH